MDIHFRAVRIHYRRKIKALKALKMKRVTFKQTNTVYYSDVAVYSSSSEADYCPAEAAEKVIIVFRWIFKLTLLIMRGAEPVQDGFISINFILQVKAGNNLCNTDTDKWRRHLIRLQRERTGFDGLSEASIRILPCKLTL